MADSTKEFFRISYFLAISLLLAGLPWSRYMMSLSQFLLSALFLWDHFDIVELSRRIRGKPSLAKFFKVFLYIFENAGKTFVLKFGMLFRNKVALTLVSVYILHALGILYSSNYQEYFTDLRIKAPLFVLPLVILTSSYLKKKDFPYLLLIYILTVFIVSLFSTFKLVFGEVENLREITRISHIRVSLNVCLAIFSVVYLLFKNGHFKGVPVNMGKGGLILLGLWLIVFLFLLRSLNGIIIFIAIVVFQMLVQFFKSRKLIFKLGLLLVFMSISVAFYLYISGIVKAYNAVETVDLTNLDSQTPYGHKYIHDTVAFPVENGTYPGLYISWNELRENWNKRSSYDFEGKDDRDQFIRYTIIRFLNSKGLRKDADGIYSLTEDEIRYIESGLTNISHYKKYNFKIRIHEILWGINNYRANRDPNGNSMMQRYEYWKTSWSIIKSNWLTGVGNGDLKDAFNVEYEKMQSKLLPQWRHHSHNQYLRMTATFGIIGLLWFLFMLIYPPLKAKKFRNFLYTVFFMIAVLSMLAEDTLETQAGVTFVAFFNTFLLSHLNTSFENQDDNEATL